MIFFALYFFNIMKYNKYMRSYIINYFKIVYFYGDS